MGGVAGDRRRTRHQQDRPEETPRPPRVPARARDAPGTKRMLAQQPGIEFSDILIEPTFNSRPNGATSSYLDRKGGVITDPLTRHKNLLSDADQRTISEQCGPLYEEALKLYPSAQSAVVALLIVKPAGSIAPGSPLPAVLQAPAAERTDPWLSYSIGPGRHVDKLMSAVWR